MSFRVAAGRALLLTGPNGAGKTSLLRTVAGLARPAVGQILLEGGDGPLGEQCHWIGHLNAVKGALTVDENARFWADYLQGERARVGDALDRFGLAALAHIPAAYLSAGQKRRLGLTRLLLAPRPIWLLDEPTVSLDAASTAMLADVIREHVDAGGIVLAATHLPLGLEAADVLKLGRAPET